MKNIKWESKSGEDEMERRVGVGERGLYNEKWGNNIWCKKDEKSHEVEFPVKIDMNGGKKDEV